MSHDTPPFLRGARFRAYDPETDVVGDPSAWDRRRVLCGLAWFAFFAALIWLGSVAFPFGEWR
jgi:hypothetical protein